MARRAARRRLAGRLAWSVALAIGAHRACAAQTAGTARRARTTCDGDTITSVEVHSHSPSATNIATDASRTTTRFLGVPYVPTRPAVVAAYLRVTGGDVCTELDRSESERLLRTQPFISSATVRAVPDGPGHVRLLVDVVDELPLIVGGSISRGTVSSLLLGTQNLRGRGVALSMSVERGFAYRDGFGVSATKYAMFGRPDFLSVSGERTPVGDGASLEFAEPFLTDLQVRAFHTHFSIADDYYGVTPPQGDVVSLSVRRSAYDVGFAARIGNAATGGPIGLLGVALLGEDVSTGAHPVVVSDSGFIAAPAGALRAFAPLASARLAGIAGLRALRFTTVRGFDALTATQDMGIGVQLDVLAGPGLWTSDGSHDLFVSGDLYAGMGDERSFVVARALAEMRDDRDTQTWTGVVASSRVAWYRKTSDTRTALVSLEYSGVQGLSFPLQLSFRDADGGLPGFGGATWSGAQRVIARVEQRTVLQSV